LILIPNVLASKHWKIDAKYYIFVQRRFIMNIQSRKLELIEQFLHISDETLITKLESFLKNEQKASYNKKLTPMSMEEFHTIIDTSKNDAAEGRVVSHQDLKKRVKTWK
jgi:hypothetical protein